MIWINQKLNKNSWEGETPQTGDGKKITDDSLGHKLLKVTLSWCHRLPVRSRVTEESPPRFQLISKQFREHWGFSVASSLFATHLDPQLFFITGSKQKYSLMVFPGPECRRSKRISFWVLSARMTNPSSSTSRGEFCGNEWEHTRTEEGEREADSSWIRDKRLISDTKKGFVTRCNWALRPARTESFPLVGIIQLKNITHCLVVGD